MTSQVVSPGEALGEEPMETGILLDHCTQSRVFVYIPPERKPVRVWALRWVQAPT